MHNRAEEYRVFKLTTKAMRVLVAGQIRFARDSLLTKQIQMSKKQILFERWFELVHRTLPNFQRAEAFCLKSKFSALAKYVNKRRDIRNQKRLLKALSADYAKTRLISSGITWLYLHSQKEIYKRNRRELVEKVWLAKLYRKWKDTVPELCAENHYERLIHNFRLEKLVSVCMTKLFMYSTKKKAQRELVLMSRHKAAHRRLLQCLAAILDHNHSNKIKLRRLVELVQPGLMKA